MLKLITPKKYESKKLSTYLFKEIPGLSYNLFYKLLRKKDIKINEKRINKDILLKENDEIIIYINENNLLKLPNLKIIYEDENILLVDKPICVEITGNNSLTTILEKQYEKYNIKPMPCHRLDRNTTGLVLYAKNLESLHILENKFKNHEIEKHYIAVVYGHPKVDEQKCEAYLFKDNKKALVYIYDNFKKGTQKIITYYKVLKRCKDNTSILDIKIETGKTHQIRAHLAHLGFPIIGDGKYGINKINKQFGKRYQMLTSYSLTFNFVSKSGILEYLNGKEFKKEKYF